MSSSNNLASSNLDPSLAATPLSNGHDASLTSARIYARHLFPAHGAHVYLLLELIALFPAEVRTLLRIARRWQQQHTEERHQQQEYGDFSSGIKMRKRRPDGLVSLHEVGLFVIKVRSGLSQVVCILLASSHSTLLPIATSTLPLLQSCARSLASSAAICSAQEDALSRSTHPTSPCSSTHPSLRPASLGVHTSSVGES